MSTDMRASLSRVVALLCHQVGFETITEAALDLLLDQLWNYMRSMSYNLALLAEDCKCACKSLLRSSFFVADGIASPLDGMYALKLMGTSPSSMLQFLEDVGPFLPKPFPELCGPLAGKVHLNIPPPGHPELILRPEHILRHLPLGYCETTTHAGNMIIVLTTHLRINSDLCTVC